MRAYEFLKESTTTLNKLYNGNFPDRDESFWDEVRPHEFDNELEVKVLPKHKLTIMIQSQYRVEHLDELLDMMDEDQQEILQRYMNDPNLSNKIILLSGDRIIDGNHRALAAAMKGMSINYVDLADLDEQDVTEDTDKLSYIGNCTDDDVIEHLFGDATGFAQAVEEYGDDFELDDLVVKYDPETDIHSFYYKQKGVAEDSLNEFAPNDDGEDRNHEYEVYQCNPEDQFEWIGGPIYKTDDIGKAHVIAHNLHKKHPNKAFMIWQERTEGSRGAYGIKDDEQGVAESIKGITPTGYTWSFEHGGEVPYKSEVEVNTFIRVRDSKGKTVLGVWADVYRDDVEIQYSEVFDKKLRGKGIYTDFLKGLAKHYNIISDQDQNNAARNIYKKLGADYNRKTEKHTLRRTK